jgi:hypothetical protein
VERGVRVYKWCGEGCKGCRKGCNLCGEGCKGCRKGCNLCGERCKGVCVWPLSVSHKKSIN